MKKNIIVILVLLVVPLMIGCGDVVLDEPKPAQAPDIELEELEPMQAPEVEQDEPESVGVPQAKQIATITNMGVAVDFYSYTLPYLLVVVLKPMEAVANQMYIVDLYEKGALRDTATVQWNQLEINVAKEREVVFPSTGKEYEAYSSEDISHIFSVKVYEE